MKPKDILLAPLYLYQAQKLDRAAIRLPEADGERHGSLLLKNANTTDPARKLKTLNLMIVGDSSAAGVGVKSQQDAITGHLLNSLKDRTTIQERFDKVDWTLHATSGHTSFDILRRLYVTPNPTQAIDIMLIMMGVNDTTSSVKPRQWQKQLNELITLSKRKFGVKHILLPYLPPMSDMPSIPKPLNRFLGAKTDIMNQKLQEVCDAYKNVFTLPVDFTEAQLSPQEMFSEDGFHPNTTAYAFWANKLANKINELV